MRPEIGRQVFRRPPTQIGRHHGRIADDQEIEEGHARPDNQGRPDEGRHQGSADCHAQADRAQVREQAEGKFEMHQGLPEQAAAPAAAARPPLATVSHTATAAASRELPAEAAFTILVGSFPLRLDTTAPNVASTTEWLEASGFRVFYAEVDLGSHGRWQRVLAGAYTDSQAARRDADRLRAAAPQSDAHLVSAGFAIGLAPRQPDTELRPSGTEP